MPARNEDLHGMVPDKAEVALLLLDVINDLFNVPDSDRDFGVFRRYSDAQMPLSSTENFMDESVLRRQVGGRGVMKRQLEHIVATRAFLTHFERDYGPMNEVYRSYFPENRLPARTCVGVTGLARRALVEIDFIARRP